jgi:hypothetical protein
MVSRSVQVDAIDEAFTKLLIEELADRDRIADLTDEALPDVENTGTHWETVANVQVPSDPNGKLEIDAGRPSGESSVNLPPFASGTPQHWELRVKYQDGRECTLPLEDKPITIGRGRDNAITVNCDRVSRHHARIQVDARGPRADDLSSRNGILVNGIKVPAAYLKPGDVLRIGTVEIHVNPAE